jgi:hypothetical protein
MSAPTEAREFRVKMLDAAAAIAGFTHRRALVACDPMSSVPTGEVGSGWVTPKTPRSQATE